MIERPAIVVTTPVLYASLYQVAPASSIRETMSSGIKEVEAVLSAQGIARAGAWFTHHLRRPTDVFDFEIGFPTEHAIAPAGRVKPKVWPSMRVARALHRGSYATLVDSWGELEAWIKAQGLTGGTEFWEQYRVNPNDTEDAAKFETELNWPLLG